MSIRTRILGPAAGLVLVAGFGLATVPAGAAPGPVGPDDITICEEDWDKPGDECPDKPKGEKPPEPPQPPEPPDLDEDAPKQGRPSFTG
jgi:hypothetical protein